MLPVKKQESIPRAETQAEVIGTEMAFKLSRSYEFSMEDCTFFSDSTTLLWWLRTRNPLTIFVANRICQIKDRTTLGQWLYVRTDMNPADIPTRGKKVRDLEECNLWWKGPEFLTMERDQWPEQPEVISGQRGLGRGQDEEKK